MLTVHFIRHAESESNAGMRTKHPATIRLTEKGLEQARLTSQIFENAPDLIVTSPYIRTQTTAAPLIERFPGTPRVEWPVQEFTYLDPSHWNGTTGQERQPAARAYWERSDPLYHDGGGAESFMDLIERVERTRQLILEQTMGNIVIFSHGQFTRTFWWRMAFPNLVIDSEVIKRYLHFIRGVSFPNCAIIKFRFYQEEVWCSGVDVSHIPPELLTY
jgi:broad specificity phosphatase PhoE